MSDHSHTSTTDATATHGGHDDHAHGSFISHVRIYLLIGAILFAATGVTVGLSYIDFAEYSVFRKIFAMIGVHGMGINIIVGLTLATAKVCLVGAWFMHLKSETKTIWRPLLFTFFFCGALFALFMLAHSDPIPTSGFTKHGIQYGKE